MDIYILFAVAAAAALATKLAKDYATRTQLLDIPTERSSHIRPVPRGGGAGFVAVTLAAALVLFARDSLTSATTLALAIGGTSVAVIGWMDDRRSRPAALRFAVHCAAAAWALLLLCNPGTVYLFRIEISILSPDYTPDYAVFFFLAITWLINSYNFMDGIDGIAAGEAVAVGFLAAFLCESEAGPLCLLTGAAVLGFLPWNWPRAKIFMGDVGSGFLGFAFALAWLVEARANPDGFYTLPILLGCFISDATLTLFWRIVHGERWYTAHKLHVYQTYSRLFSHRAVTVVFVVITVVWLAPFAWLAKEYPAFGLLFAAAAYAPLVGFVVYTHVTRTQFSGRDQDAVTEGGV